ncbi:MAG: hypothetical protein WCJ35_19075 [Planctomycetota bacterium]
MAAWPGWRDGFYRVCRTTRLVEVFQMFIVFSHDGPALAILPHFKMTAGLHWFGLFKPLQSGKGDWIRLNLAQLYKHRVRECSSWRQQFQA